LLSQILWEAMFVDFRWEPGIRLLPIIVHSELLVAAVARN
jgi:hypothetical protein